MKHPKILILDNYDSFTYNLVRCVEEAAPCSVTVIKNDECRTDTVAGFDKIIFSPGAGVPSAVPAMANVLSAWGGKKSILGVCLGHQAIAEFFGARLVNYTEPFHGLSAAVTAAVPDETLFAGIRFPFAAGLYHSWGVDPASVPACLAVTAVSDGGVVMALRHTSADIRGVQFHPESYLTPVGAQMLRNWITA